MSQASGCQDQGRYEEAESLYKRALLAASETFSQDDPEWITLLNNFAVLYKYMGRFADARPLYRRALFLSKRIRPGDSLGLAALYHNLGGLDHARGSYKRGAVFARRSVQLREEALGPIIPMSRRTSRLSLRSFMSLETATKQRNYMNGRSSYSSASAVRKMSIRP